MVYISPSGTGVESMVGEGAFGEAVGGGGAGAAEAGFGGENWGGTEGASVEGLVPVGLRAVVVAFGAEEVFVGPGEETVEGEEEARMVNNCSLDLVDFDKIVKS